MQHKLLARQLRRAFGLVRPEELDTLLGTLQAGGVAAFVNGFGELLQAIDQSYRQYDRDLDLRTLSLEISSEELIVANDKLRSEAARQRQALHSLQSTLQRLTDGKPSPQGDAFDDDFLLLMKELEALVKQREDARDALAENETRIHRILENLREVVFQMNAEGMWTYLNPAWEQITGFSVDNTLGQNAFSFVHPEDRDRGIEQSMLLISREKEFCRYQLRYLTKDGGHRWLEVFAAPIVGENGTIGGVSGTLNDITEQKVAQDQLSTSEERLKLALLASDTSLLDWDLTEAHPYIDPKWAVALGYHLEAPILLNIDWLKQIHPDDQSRWHEQMAQHLHHERSDLDMELRFATCQGGWLHASFRGRIVAWDGEKARRLAGVLQDITEKRRSDELIWKQANFDILTGLPNRGLFRDRLNLEIIKAQRDNGQMALIFVDLDRFKEVNDTLGHDAGDLLLIEAARRIQQCVRASDTVARLSGDEFTVILPGLKSKKVEYIVQKILDRLAEPFQIRNEVAYLSASIGITLYPADATEPESLIKNADQAMYVAKREGRNRFSYYTRLMQEDIQTRLRLSTDLRSALATGQLKVHFQPVLDLSTGCIVKAEALLRWNHPTRGMVPPAKFIPLAEEYGLIDEIGDWVFKESASWSERWSSQLGQPFQISVNKSPIQFLTKANRTSWPRHLTELGLPGSCIAVEITEGLLLNASPAIAEQLLQYKEAGIQVAIDDFGTGYSSMSYLKKFHIDYLKIDQSFVRDMATDPGDRTIVETIILMAHKLGFKVIAEGVETTLQRNLLAAAHCDFAQGYLFSPAVSPEEFEKFLHKQERHTNLSPMKL
jgi:diguanylate cyclase (GGDEF)-like protein/PAS domain S-box-containing protein